MTNLPPILVGLIFALLIGSRFSYPLINLGGNFFPEPLLFLLFLSYVIPKNRLSKHILVRFTIVVLLFLFLILFTIVQDLSFLAAYRTARPLFLSIGLSFVFLNRRLFESLDKQNIIFILFIFLSFSIGSVILGVLSLSLQPSNTALILYGGLRSTQPSLAPLTFFISALTLQYIYKRLTFFSLLIYFFISSSLVFVQFFVGLSRLTLISFFPLCLWVFVLYLENPSKIIGSKLRINKVVSFSLVLIVVVLLLKFDLTSLDMLSTDNAFGETTYYYDLLTSQIDRLTNPTSNNLSNIDIRLASLIYIPLHFYQFLIPHGFNIDDTSYIDLAFFSDIDAIFLSIRDSGFLYILHILGFVIVFLFAYFFFKYIAFVILMLARHTSSSRFYYRFLLVGSFYFLFSFYGSDKVVKIYSESFHFLCIILLSCIVVPRAILLTSLDKQLSGTAVRNHSLDNL